jgi:F5/8 type C domain
MRRFIGLGILLLLSAQLSFASSHRYWRLYITDSEGAGGVVSVVEWKLFDSTGTLLTGSGTASASSVCCSDPASNAFDADISTFWASAALPTTGSPQWLEYDFGSAQDVRAIIIIPRGSNFQEPKTFKLQYSDDNSTWSDAFGLLTPPYFSIFGIGFAVDTPATGFYVNWRINITLGQIGATGQAAAEIGFHTTVGGSSVSSGGVAWGDSGANTPALSFDADTTTYGYETSSPGYIAYAMPFPKKIIETNWTLRNDSFGVSQAPLTGTIDGSNDGGVTWTTTASFCSLTWTTAGQTQVLACTAAATQIGGFLTGP